MNIHMAECESDFLGKVLALPLISFVIVSTLT